MKPLHKQLLIAGGAALGTHFVGAPAYASSLVPEHPRTPLLGAAAVSGAGAALLWKRKPKVAAALAGIGLAMGYHGVALVTVEGSPLPTPSGNPGPLPPQRTQAAPLPQSTSSLQLPAAEGPGLVEPGGVESDGQFGPARPETRPAEESSWWDWW